MKRKSRNEKAVWEALVRIGEGHFGNTSNWATIGQVAEVAEISRPTAKKYLDKLVEEGKIVYTKALTHRFTLYSTAWTA